MAHNKKQKQDGPKIPKSHPVKPPKENRVDKLKQKYPTVSGIAKLKFHAQRIKRLLK